MGCCISEPQSKPPTKPQPQSPEKTQMEKVGSYTKSAEPKKFAQKPGLLDISFFGN